MRNLYILVITFFGICVYCGDILLSNSWHIKNSRNLHEHIFFLCVFSWINAAKFLTGASAVGSVAIPSILKHAGLIGWGALALDLSSYIVFLGAILCYVGIGDGNDNYYSYI